MIGLDADEDARNRWLNADLNRNGHHWVGREVLGSGSYGIAGLWQRADAENNIVGVSFVWQYYCIF